MIAINRTLERDPTRTLTLRKQWIAEATKRWKNVAREVRGLILDQDIFELERANPFIQPMEGGRDTRINHFVDVTLSDILSREILSEQDRPGTHWQAPFIETAFSVGVRRGEAELRKGGFLRTDTPRMRVIDSFARSGRLSSLKQRGFSELEGIIAAVKQNVKRALQNEIPFEEQNTFATNISLGERVWEAIRKVLEVIGLNRNKVEANTETVRSHHKGTLDAFETNGVTDVIILAEFTTARDDRVCPECAALEGKIFTLEEIENVIPVHPNCRCIALPVEVERPRINKKQEIVPTISLSPEIITKIEKETKVYKDVGRNIITPKTIERIKSNFIGSSLEAINEVIDHRKKEIKGISEIVERDDGTVLLHYTDGTGQKFENLKGKEGEPGNEGVGIIGIDPGKDGSITIRLSDGSSQKVDCRGKQGTPGVGIQNISVAKRTLVVELTDGRTWDFKTLAGLDGKTIKGDKGKAGIGIKEAGIVAGNLTLAYTNGGIHNLGKVTGTDGIDGIGVLSATINASNELIMGTSDGKEINAGTFHINQNFLEDFEFSRARNAIRWMKNGVWTEWMNIPRSGGGGVITKISSSDGSIAISPASGRGDIDLSVVSGGSGVSVGHIFEIDVDETLTIAAGNQFDHLGRFPVNGRKVINGRFVLGIGANL